MTYSEIVCTTSSNEAGLVDVTVGDSTLSGAFTFENTAASGSVSPSTLSVLGMIYTRLPIDYIHQIRLTN